MLRRHGITDNPLQIAVLNLFVTLKSRFPNLVVGQITRDSVKKALANGITADQVCVPCTSCSRWNVADSHQDHQLPHHARTPSNAQECKSDNIFRTTAEQVLNSFALFQKPLLPVTVQDQIRLWELEKNRVKSQEGHCRVI